MILKIVIMRIRFFKNKEKRRQFLMILFLFMIFGSVFAFTFGTAFMYRTPESRELTEREMIEKFSKHRIFDEPLTEGEEWFLVNRGITIATYYYIDSPEFFELEEFVNSLEGQLVVERIKGNETKLELISARASATVENFTKENILQSLCDVLYQPPPECAR